MAVTKYLPLIFSILVGVGAGLRAQLVLRNIIYSFFFAIPGWYMSFTLGESSRNLLLDYSDYRKELPTQELRSVDSFETKRISHTYDKPTYQDTYVSTLPGQQLYLEERQEIGLEQIETLDGVSKESKQLNGETVFTWQKDRIQRTSTVTKKNTFR